MPSPDLSGPVIANAPGATRADAGTAPVKAAIARAAAATGVNFSYLLAQAKLESGLNPQARAATSSASGLYQFTTATWAQTLAKHGDVLGLAGGFPGVSGAGAGAPANPATRAQWMALRNDPAAAAMMAAALAGDNQVALTNQLGRPPQASELYLAHFLGADGAAKFLAALQTDPTQPAAALLPRAAASNRAVFYDAGGQPRSLSAVMALVQTRMDDALAATGGTDPNALEESFAGGFAGGADGGAAPLAVAAPNGGPIAQEFASAQSNAAAAAGVSGPAPAGSMADTLAATFGLADNSTAAAPGFVRAAYGRMRQLGL